MSRGPTAWQFVVWQPIYHNDEYSHVISRRVTIKAETQEQAEDRLLLQGRQEQQVHEGLVIRAEPEYVKGCYRGFIEVREVFVPVEVWESE